MSKVTIFRLDTGGADAGEHIRTGNTNDPKTQDLVAQGHTLVNGNYTDKYKYDYATSTVIIDTDKIQAAQDRAQRKSDLAQRRVIRMQEMIADRDNVQGGGQARGLPELNDIVNKIIDYLEKVD